MDEAHPTPVQEPFELSGGNLCLDFVNTWADRGRPETDGLKTYGLLLAFARQTHLIDAQGQQDLAMRAQAKPGLAHAALRAARNLREALYGICSARAHDRGLPNTDLACLNGALREALSNLQLGFQGKALAWQWPRAAAALTSPLWPITWAAAELLTGDGAPIRECGGEHCTWLFLDVSRGHSRRWCSMASCGNRAKARRHYHRQSRPSGP